MADQPGGKVFRSTLTSRRFPALGDLTGDDVDVVVMQNPAEGSPAKRAGASKGKSSSLFDPELVKPSAADSLSSPSKARAAAAPAKREAARPPKGAKPFRPSNWSEARADITVAKHGYVSMHSPYDAAHRQRQQELQESGMLNVTKQTFIPASAATAKSQVAVNYFLNSPDAETLDAEREYIRERSRRSVQVLKESGLGRARAKRY